MPALRYAMLCFLGVALTCAQDTSARGWEWCVGSDGYVYNYYPSGGYYASGGYSAGPVYAFQGAYPTQGVYQSQRVYQANRPGYAQPQYQDQSRQYAYRPVQGQPDRRGNVVQMTDEARFEPALVTVDVGQTVEWRSTSRHAHTVTANPEMAASPAHVVLPEGAQPFHSGEIAPGGQFSHTFEVPGIYYYVCLPHEEMGMVGIVVVRSPREGGRQQSAPPREGTSQSPPAAPQSPGGARGY